MTEGTFTTSQFQMWVSTCQPLHIESIYQPECSDGTVNPVDYGEWMQPSELCIWWCQLYESVRIHKLANSFMWLHLKTKCIVIYNLSPLYIVKIVITDYAYCLYPPWGANAFEIMTIWCKFSIIYNNIMTFPYCIMCDWHVVDYKLCLLLWLTWVNAITVWCKFSYWLFPTHVKLNKTSRKLH